MRSWEWEFFEKRLHTFIVRATNNVKVDVLLLEILKVQLFYQLVYKIPADVAIEMAHENYHCTIRFIKSFKSDFLVVFSY